MAACTKGSLKIHVQGVPKNSYTRCPKISFFHFLVLMSYITLPIVARILGALKNLSTRCPKKFLVLFEIFDFLRVRHLIWLPIHNVH